MSVYQWLSLFGVPSLIVGLITYIHKVLNELRRNNKALKDGTQALLRAQMVNDYNKWRDRGYAPIYARENFENCWVQYHALGANGVMDNIHTIFLTLPTEPQEVQHEQ